MNMAVAKCRYAGRLAAGRGKVAGAVSMTPLNDEPTQAIPVLLVEDDAPTSWRLQDALVKAGYQVRAAATLAEARAYLAESAPKVLLTDLQLPDGHGVD